MKHILPVIGVLLTLAPICNPLALRARPAPPPAPAKLPAAPSAPAATPAAPAVSSQDDGPRIRMGETSFDFGKIKSSEVVRHDFIVTNAGNAVLEITEVRPGCPGCTTALPWDHQIEPGKTGKIPIQFNPASFSGTVGKSVGVVCNDPTQPNIGLTFHATVWRPIDVQPAFVYFMAVEGETNESKVVHISSHLEEPLKLETPQCSNPAFKTELKEMEAGKEFELHISYSGPVTNTTAQGYVSIKTSFTNIPMLNITAQAMVQPALALMPAQITLPAGPLPPGHRHSQVIRNNSNNPMKITDASVNAEGVTVQITEPQPGKFFVVVVSFPANFQVATGEPVELTMHTSNPRHAVLKLPIVQTAPSTPVIGTPAPTAATLPK